MKLFFTTGVPAANRVTPPPLADQVFPEIVLFKRCAADAATMVTPPPPTPPLQPCIWRLLVIRLSLMRGEPKLLEIPPPPSPAVLFVMMFPAIVGDEFSMRMPPPRRPGDPEALPFCNVKPLICD